MSHQMTEISRKNVILDKSFLQAESRACRRLRALRQCGCTFILTDTLVYELCTGSRDSLWAEAQRKLFEFADSIEVWQHTGELLRDELAAKSPLRHPVDKELTKRTRHWLGRRTEQVPSDLRSLADAAHQQREVDSVEALVRMCRTFCGICAEPYDQIRRHLGQGKNLGPQMDALVNDERILKRWIHLKHGNPEATDVYLKDAEHGLAPEWFAYHEARSSLALWCVFMLKYGEKDIPGKEFRNTKLDADYATLLHYADALATNETSGSLADICSWLYRGSKKLFSTWGLDAVMPTEARIRLDAYIKWDCGGRTHGHDFDDWLSAERALMAQMWDRLGIEHDSATGIAGLSDLEDRINHGGSG
jgi:DUF2934 family protein